MKKILTFYTHNFGGLGHNKRISLIIKEILFHYPDKYSCILLNSGENQDYLFENIKGLRVINLPNFSFQGYKKIGNFKKIEMARKIIFDKLFSFPLKIETLIIEHFPFGRNFLNDEIVYLINTYKQHNHRGKVISSVRDVFDIKALNTLNLAHFDRFLIHTDEAINSYDSFFEEEIHNKMIYTGYVVENQSEKDIPKEKIIYINIGGGQDGVDSVIDFLSKFSQVHNNKEYKVIVSLGKNYTENTIQAMCEVYTGNIEIFKFLDTSLELKLKSEICVSMGGYNNMVESLRYNIKTIIYPRKSDDEQIIRLESFTKISKNFYNGNTLQVSDIEKILQENAPNAYSNKIDFNGATLSANFIVNNGKYKYIKIRLTNACNAKCEMCGVIKRKRQNNNIDYIKDSILDFYKIGGEVVNFTGGEPTIYKGFFELLAFTKGLGLITSVSTNGSTLGMEFFKKIVHNGVKLIDYIDISVDGLNEKHDVRRVYKGLFSIISNNLPILKKLGIFIHINVTVRNDNIGEMKSIFDYFKQAGVDSLSFGMISTAPINDTLFLFPSRSDLKKFYTEDKKYILEHAGNMKVSFSPDFLSGNINTFINSICNEHQFYREEGKKCDFIQGKNEIRINENGEIAPCCIIDDFDVGLGNINHERLLKILCSNKYEGFLNKTFPNISKACLKCKINL